MKVTRFLASLMFLGAVSTSAFAVPAVSLNWDTCVGPIDKSILPATTGNTIWISVLGQNVTAQAYQVQITIGGNGPLRDAWRFDPAGCQGSSLLVINHITSSKTCPSFQGALASVQVKDYSYDALSGKAKATLYNAYPNNAPSGAPQGNPAATNPAQRYFLGNLVFDQTYGVNGPSDPGLTCGGLEVGTCFALSSATWLDTTGAEIPWAVAGDHVTSNDPNNLSRCPASVPTKATTWGNLKGQYR